MNLRATAPDTMVGKLVSSDAGLGNMGLALSDVSAKRIGDPPGIQQLASASNEKPQANALNIPELDPRVYAADWAYKVMSDFTDEFQDKYRPSETFWGNDDTFIDFFKWGAVIKNGGGYYMAGDYGPGPQDATCTFYYPLEWGKSGERTYHFTFRAGEVRSTIDYLVEHVTKIQGLTSNPYVTQEGCLGFESVDVFKSQVRDFHQKYGDFAFTVARDYWTNNSALYINLLDASKAEEAKKHPVTTTLLGSLLGKQKFLYVGRDIADTLRLRRPVAIIDGSPLLISYVFGTIHVKYD